jgi:hypothetical protein
MRILRNFVAATGLGLTVLAVASLSAFALTVPPTYAPRTFPSQQTHYLRFAFNFNSCVTASNACTVKVGALPYNAFLTTIHSQIITTFNPTTSATVSLGVVSTGGAGVMAALNVFTGQSTAAVTNTTFTGAGELVTGSGATPTGADGGFDLFATYTVGGGAATQGQVIFIVEYIAANDGSCAPVPLGATAVAC